MHDYGAAESWLGSYYELAIEVSTAPADERLAACVERLWSCAAMVGGPWPDKSATHEAVMPQLPAAEEMLVSYGLLHIRDLGDVQCASWIIREVGGGSDWLDLSIPTAALERFGLSYPLLSKTPCALIERLDRALLDVAVHLFAAVPFELAVIGEEVSGMWSSETVTAGELPQGGFLLPEPLARRLGAFATSRAVAPALVWVPNRCEEPSETISG